MNYAEVNFKNEIGVYCPEKIKKCFAEFGEAVEGGMMPRYTFKDGSFITTYGGEIVDINGDDGEEEEDE